MPASDTDWFVRELSPGDADFIPALNLTVTSRLKLSESLTPPVRDLLDCQSAGGLRLRPVVGAYAENVLQLSVAVMESPGASNLFLLPFDLPVGPSQRGGVLALQFALARSKGYGVSLSQVVGPARESNWDVVLEEAGFSRLTHLVYMTCLNQAEHVNASGTRSRNQDWVVYSAETESLFGEAIERSYADSLDCPEIANLRTVRQSLMAHRAVGMFDPGKWFVLKEGQTPLGVLLLNKVRNEPVLEIVYMGVSQVARGKGVGDILMTKALEVGAAESTRLILAVDVRNVPAQRLYRRWGFTEIARRAAWIASMCSIRC